MIARRLLNNDRLNTFPLLNFEGKKLKKKKKVPILYLCGDYINNKAYNLLNQ